MLIANDAPTARGSGYFGFESHPNSSILSPASRTHLHRRRRPRHFELGGVRRPALATATGNAGGGGSGAAPGPPALPAQRPASQHSGSKRLGPGYLRDPHVEPDRRPRAAERPREGAGSAASKNIEHALRSLVMEPVVPPTRPADFVRLQSPYLVAPKAHRGRRAPAASRPSSISARGAPPRSPAASPGAHRPGN